MPRVFLLFLLAIPIIELWLLIAVGGVIGGLNCVLLVIATALIGGFIARKQGFDTVNRIRERSAMGEPVVAEVIDAFALLIAGLMLLFPGLLTDMLGFLMLIPRFRRHLHAGLVSPFNRCCAESTAHQAENNPFYTYSESPRSSQPTDKVIDIDTTKQ